MAKESAQQSSSTVSLSKGSDSSVETAVAREPLEVHPGSPIDLSGRRRPSLAAAMAAQRSAFRTQARDLKPVNNSVDNGVIADGVVAKSLCHCESLDSKNGPRTKVQTAATQPFFIPAKVPEQLEIHNLPSPSDDGMSLDSVVDSALNFDFQEENGVWISAIPRAHDSHSSFATCNTTSSTLVEGRYNHGGLSVDTNVACSAASLLSSSASLISGTTNCSDVYGWEEELDRKSSLESYSSQTRDHQRRLPLGGRSLGPYVRNETLNTRPMIGKRKSLLHRVLNISRRDLDEPVPNTRVLPFPTSMN